MNFNFMDKIIALFLWSLIFLFAGYFWRYFQEDTHLLKNLEHQIQYQLSAKEKSKFYIKDTNIEITPWRDGSGVIRIINMEEN